MANFGTQVRRGLPRQPGGDPWPPGGTVAVAGHPVGKRAERDETPAAFLTAAAVPVVERAQGDETRANGIDTATSASPVVERAERDETRSVAPPAARVAPGDVSSRDSVARSTTEGAGRTVLRRGLPRSPGGEPWPRADAVAAIAPSSAPSISAAAASAVAEPTAVEPFVAAG